MTTTAPVVELCACMHAKHVHEQHADIDGRGPCRRGSCPCTHFREPQSNEPATGGHRYTASQVCSLTGATYRQIDFWCRAGYLDDTANGSGSRRMFTSDELDTIHAAVGLIREGFTVAAAFRIARALVTDDEYRAEFGDIWRIHITLRPTEEVRP